MKVAGQEADQRTGLFAASVGYRALLCKLALMAILALLWCLVRYETGLLSLGGLLNPMANPLSWIVFLLVPSVIGFIKARRKILEVIACVASFHIFAMAFALGVWRDGI